jgi:L-fuconolactonase
MPGEFIDSHHHLWKYSADQYPWMIDGMDELRKDFLVPELHAVTRQAGITGTIAVQARQRIEETEWLLSLANKSDLILGIVGWLPLVGDKVESHLEAWSGNRKLRGLRHVLHDEIDDFYVRRQDFNRGISLLKEFGLVYDILIFERHLPQTIQFVDRHPNQVFIIDHMAKPKIKDHIVSPWNAGIAELARRENVYCKISGMVTEADWKSWTQDDLRPYFDTVLDAFGPHRLMFGSDWPVIQVACDYNRWSTIVKSWSAGLSSGERQAIMAETAKKAYSLH